ncbi:hypothetical protein BN2537_14525 [Streptomyces venezuelae]|nr:hypothetical protein BN2537_14525 [Streptomyces venezuelae]
MGHGGAFPSRKVTADGAAGAVRAGRRGRPKGKTTAPRIRRVSPSAAGCSG